MGKSRKPPPSTPAQQRPPPWRELDAPTRLKLLASHFPDPADLAEAVGVSIKTINAIWGTLRAGKRSHVLERPELVEGLRRARRRMTDHTRRVIQNAKRGKYVSPIVKTPYGAIAPTRDKITLRSKTPSGIRETIADSFWVKYHVEHLSEAEIFHIARAQFELYMDTGQYNLFRFEFLANSTEYPGADGFERDELRVAAQHHELIKLSTPTLAISQFDGSSDRFINYIIKKEWRRVEAKGAVRIQTLCWSLGEDKYFLLAQANRQKLKRQRIKKRKGPKGGFR